MASAPDREKKIATSLRLTPGGVALLEKLADRWGVTRTEVIEQLLREAAREDTWLRVVKGKAED